MDIPPRRQRNAKKHKKKESIFLAMGGVNENHMRLPLTPTGTAMVSKTRQVSKMYAMRALRRSRGEHKGVRPLWPPAAPQKVTR